MAANEEWVEISPGHPAHGRRGRAHGPHGRPDIFRRADEAFELVEHILIFVVGLFLIGFAMLALFNTLVMLRDPIFVEHDYTKAITIGFDSAFLTIILLEVLHTVLTRSSLMQQIREFLVIGITSAVRHSLEVAAAGNGTHQELHRICTVVAGTVRSTCQIVATEVPNTSSQEVVLELAINAGAVLVLVAAFWLVGQGKVAAG